MPATSCLSANDASPDQDVPGLADESFGQRLRLSPRPGPMHLCGSAFDPPESLPWEIGNALKARTEKSPGQLRRAGANAGDVGCSVLEWSGLQCECRHEGSTRRCALGEHACAQLNIWGVFDRVRCDPGGVETGLVRAGTDLESDLNRCTARRPTGGLCRRHRHASALHRVVRGRCGRSSIEQCSIASALPATSTGRERSWTQRFSARKRGISDRSTSSLTGTYESGPHAQVIRTQFRAVVAKASKIVAIRAPGCILRSAR